MSSASPDRLDEIRDGFGLSQRQADVLRSLIETGGVRETAQILNISYVAARNTVADLKAKLGVDTIPMMIGMALDLAHEDYRERADPQRRLDLFQLSDRQYAIAQSLGIARSRREIGAILGISDHVIDAELKQMYLILGVRSAGEVVAVVSTAGLHTSAAACPATPEALVHDLPHASAQREGRQIGYSDFGPADGAPVLIMHSTISSRAPPTRLVAALQARGYRPIAIDRPGFGDTDMAGAGDPYEAAADDTAGLCAILGIERTDVVSRGAPQAATRLAQLYPALVGRAVLVNPTPMVTATSIDRGPLGAAKRAFARRPWAIAAMVRALAPFAKPQRMYEGMLRSFRDSPPDSALVREDAQFVADYLRATRDFGHGRVAGYVAEQVAWAKGYDVDPMPGMTDWRIVQGRHFVLHDPAQAIEYWSSRLPDTPVRWVEEAGQMLAYSHPAAVAAELPDRTR